MVLHLNSASIPKNFTFSNEKKYIKIHTISMIKLRKTVTTEATFYQKISWCHIIFRQV